MRLLTFLAKSFSYTPHSATLEEGADPVEPGHTTRVADAVVVFFHAEAKDEGEEEGKRAFRHTLKHVKWLANKRGLEHVVLHSFTHLGAESARPEWARDFARRLAERLELTGYRVWHTPFGWFSAWSIDVHGESLAKVFKQI